MGTTQGLQEAIDWAHAEGYGQFSVPAGDDLVGREDNDIYWAGTTLPSNMVFELLEGASITNGRWGLIGYSRDDPDRPGRGTRNGDTAPNDFEDNVFIDAGLHVARTESFVVHGNSLTGFGILGSRIDGLRLEANEVANEVGEPNSVPARSSSTRTAQSSRIMCAGTPRGGAAQTEVVAHPGCQSPDEAHAGVFDLGGNALEWVDSCDENG